MNRFDTPPPEGSTDATDRVAGLLAGYLITAGRAACPGTDGLTVTEAVSAFYRAAVLTGQVPEPAELVRRHPELADGIAAFVARWEPLGGRP